MVLRVSVSEPPVYGPFGCRRGRYFACRQEWGRQVAYASQFLDRDNRAHRGQAKIRSRLCALGGFDPDKWNFPPKPKWMRLRTYNRACRRWLHIRAIVARRSYQSVSR